MHKDKIISRYNILEDSCLMFMKIRFIIWSLTLIIAELYQDEIFLGTYRSINLTVITFLFLINLWYLNELILQLILVLKQNLHLLFAFDTYIIYSIVLSLFVEIQGQSFRF